MSTPQETLERVRDMVVVNSQRASLELSQSLRRMPVEHQRQHFGGDYKTGFFWLYRDDELHPDKVLECVVSPMEDAITSVYLNHRINQNMGEVMRHREMLIRAISQKVGLSVEAIGVEDPARGRSMRLAELSTGQLIDLLAESEGASVTSVAATNSHGGDLATVVGAQL